MRNVDLRELALKKVKITGYDYKQERNERYTIQKNKKSKQ